MIKRIARKELLEMVRDGRFRVLSAAVLALSLLSLAVGWKHYVDVARQHATAQAATPPPKRCRCWCRFLSC
jgi:hypothetical protein